MKLKTIFTLAIARSSHMHVGIGKNVPPGKSLEIFTPPIWTMCVRLSVTARLHALHTCFSDPLSANCAPALSAPVSPCYFLAEINYCSTTLHGQCEACACALRMPSIIIVCIYVLRAYIAATAVCDCVSGYNGNQHLASRGYIRT